MPKKVLPSITNFQEFERELLRWGFHAVPEALFAQIFKKLKFVSPWPRPGREAGFVFFRNGLTVWVWTTWVRSEQQVREVDAGWVVITKGDDPLYFSRPMPRTENFLLNLFRRAWIAGFRVANRPQCPMCGSFMDIAKGRALKARYWRCDRAQDHKNGKPQWQAWDVGLLPRIKRYVNALRRERERRKRRNAAEGKNPVPAILIRLFGRKGLVDDEI